MTRRALALSLALAAVAATLTGCGGIGSTLTFNDVEKVKVTEIRIDGSSGDVMVKTAAIDETRITRIIHHHGDPDPSYRLEGTVLTVTTDCGPDCRADYDITAPEGVKVTGRLSSGDIGLTAVASADVQVNSGNIAVLGATGDVKAVSTSGDLNVSDVAGTTTLRATSGNVRALDVRGPVQAEVTSGDLTVHLRTVSPVKADARSGNVEVIVPPGSYAVNVETRSGDEQVIGIVDDPSSKVTLDVSASSGDVLLQAGPAA